MWDSLFGIANAWAMACWAGLILLPRGPFVQSAIFYAGVGLLCLAYAVLLVLVMSGSVDAAPVEGGGAAGFTTIVFLRLRIHQNGISHTTILSWKPGWSHIV